MVLNIAEITRGDAIGLSIVVVCHFYVSNKHYLVYKKQMPFLWSNAFKYYCGNHLLDRNGDYFDFIILA